MWGETRRKSKGNLNEVMKRHENRTEPLACMLTRAGEDGNVVGVVGGVQSDRGEVG